MAQGDASVRLSVEGAETVRAALEKLGKDGEAALAKLNASGQAPTKSLGALAAGIEALKERVVGMAFSIGPMGSVLVALGPAGTVAAAGIGAVVAAMGAMSTMASELGSKAIQIREFASTTGLSTDQVQALTEAASRHGVVAEKVVGSIQKFTQGWEQMRRGGGDMLDQIRKVDGALADQMQRAANAAAAWDVFTKAVTKAEEGQRNLLLRAAGGRGGVTALSGAIAETSTAGGIGALTAQAKMAGDVVQKEMIDKLAKLKTEVDSTGERIKIKFSEMFSAQVLSNQKNAREEVEGLLNAIINFKAPEWWQDFWAWANRPIGSSAPTRLTVNPARNPVLPYGSPAADQGLRNVPATADPVPLTPEALLSRQRDMISALGGAATQAEQYREKQLALNVELKDGKITQDIYNRALAETRLTQLQATDAIRQRFGVETEGQIIIARTAELQKAIDNKQITDAGDILKARRLIALEAEQTAKALELRASLTPALTKLTQDSNNLRTSLDQGLSSALQGVSGDLLAMTKGTLSASDGLRSMTARLADAVAQALIMKSIVGPIAGGISSGLSSMFGFSLPTPGPGPLYGPGFATGGSFTVGGSGGTDTTPIRFMATPGERVTITAPGSSDRSSNGQGSGTVVNVAVNNHTDSKVDVQEQRNSSGGVDLVVMVTKAVKRDMGQGGFDSTMGQNFGARRRLTEYA
jgi:hypothetical protein